VSRVVLPALLMVLTGGCGGSLPPPVSAEGSAHRPESIPPWMLPIVRSQMAGMWDRVSELRWCAASLEFDRTADLARGLAKEAHSGRPIDRSADTLVPASYVRLQSELRHRAQQLATVATARDSHGVSEAYGAMVAVCARCHDTFKVARTLTLPSLATR
jgi:hypothetical protein